MLLLEIDKVETQKMGPHEIQVVYGVVQSEKLVVGQSVVLVGRDGAREQVMLTAVMPNYQGIKEFDEGSVGKAVKLTLRRGNPTVVLAPGATLQKLPTA